MKARKRKVDLVSIMRANSQAKEWNDAVLKKAADLTNDADKVKRLEKQLCKICHYVNTGRIGGAVMTTMACGICDVETTFSNTCVDVMCNDCATNNDLCKHCGADINLTNKRNRVIK